MGMTELGMASCKLHKEWGSYYQEDLSLCPTWRFSCLHTNSLQNKSCTGFSAGLNTQSQEI